MQGSTPWLPGDDSAERKHAPATLRNREPIAGGIAGHRQGARSGERIGRALRALFAELLPGHIWQPTDRDPSALGSIVSWCAGLDNVLPPLALDAASAE